MSDSKNHHDIVNKAADGALEAIETAHDEYDKPGDLGKAEQSAIEEYAEVVAGALVGGMGSPTADMHAAMIADAAKFYNKTTVQGVIQDAVERHADSGKQPFDELIREKLNEVIVTRSTDHNGGATFRWKFPACEITTESGRDRRGHYSWANFRDLYFEASGTDAAKPNKEVRGGDEWRDFIVDIIDERKREFEHEGPRTIALRKLRNKIRNSIGRNSADDMVNFGGVWCVVPEYDGEPLPDWWANATELAYEWEPDAGPREVPPGVEEVHVPYGVIRPVCENHDVSTRALQAEIDAEGYTIDGNRSKVSQRAYVNGNEYTYWTLSPELATPKYYDPDASSATAQTMTEENDPSPAATANNNTQQAATDGGTGSNTDDDGPNLGGLDDVPGGGE